MFRLKSSKYEWFSLTWSCGSRTLNIRIFRHLKLEIALAIPASNDEKQ